MPFDELLRAALDDTVAGLRGPLEARMRAFGAELRREADAQRDEREREAAAAAAALREQSEAHIAAIQHEANQRIAEAQREAQRHVEEARRAFDAEVAAARQAAEAEVADVRQQADAAIAEIRQRAASDAAELRTRTAAEIDDAHRIAQAQVEDVQRALDERVSSAHREVEESRREADEARRLLQDSRSTIDDVRRELEAARVEVHAALARASEDPVEKVLLDGVRAIDGARTLGQVLDGLVQIPPSAGEHLAVFVVKGDRLDRWRSADATHSGAEERMDSRADRERVLMDVVRAGTPAVGAFPITIGGAVVAVLYAGAPRRDDDRGRQAVLEVLARHASRALEAITIQRAAGLLPPAGAASRAADGTRAGGSVQ